MDSAALVQEAFGVLTEEVSQLLLTKPLPKPKRLTIVEVHQGAQEALTKLAAWSCARDIRVTRTFTPKPGYENEIRGRFDPQKREIYVSDQQGDVLALQALVHEMAHSLLHANISGYIYVDRVTCEVEAEAIAFVVLHALGIDLEDLCSQYIAWFPEYAFSHYAFLKRDPKPLDPLEVLSKVAARVALMGTLLLDALDCVEQKAA
jgi:hypothetical protein